MEESNPSQSKPARRVLPEHEGRYKVTLPAGTTERSKQILAKRAMCKFSHSIRSFQTLSNFLYSHSVFR